MPAERPGRPQINRDFVTATVTIYANGEQHTHTVVTPLVVGKFISVEAGKTAAEAAAKASLLRIGSAV